MRTPSTAAAALAVAGLASAKTFDATSKTNVVTYWGQGSNQESLVSYCQNPNIDVVNIGFVNVFPDQGKAGWPGTNFGNQCGNETYTHKNTSTQLLSNCPQIGPDIVLCQQLYGTKILLSIGGASANGYNVDDTSATNFANFLWGSFGPLLDAWTAVNGPRPFGDAVVDGFDFDIESQLSQAPTVNGSTITDYKTRGWAAMVSTFKNNLFPTDPSKQYYLSAAPQCVVPDEHLATVIASSWFDFIFVQFYNTAQCSARAAISSSSFTGYTDWLSAPSYNPAVKIYMGLAAAEKSAVDDSFYLEPSEVNTLVDDIYSETKFGGIMLWEASTAEDNVICGKDYATWMKQILEAKDAGKTIDTETSPCPAQPITVDGSCGSYTGYTCVGSLWGSCCSIYGYCGNTDEYCTASSCDPTSGDCGDEYVVVAGSLNSTSNATVSVSGNITIASSTVSLSSSSLNASSSTAFSSSASISTSGTAPIVVASASGAIGVAASPAFPLTTASVSGEYSNSSSAIADAAADSQVASSGSSSLASSQSSSVGSSLSGLATASPVAGSSSIGNAESAQLSTLMTTSTVIDTVTQTITTTNAAGEPTVYVTEDITSYTTICPVTAAEATATNLATVSYNAAPVNNNRASTYLTTSTILSTVTQTITTTNAAGEPTVYVTEDFTSYTTICPVTAAEATASANMATGTPQAANDNYGSASVKVDYVPSTKTIYSTDYVTVTSCAPSVTDCPARPEKQSTVTLTSTYAVGTTVVYVVSKSDEKTSTSTSTTTVQSTSYVYRTITVSSSTASAATTTPESSSAQSPIGSSTASVAAASVVNSSVSSVATTAPAPFSAAVEAISASSSSTGIAQSSSVAASDVNSSAGPYAYGNSSSMAYQATAGTASSTVIQIITATVAPVQAQVSQGFNVGAISGVASSTLAHNVTASTTMSAVPVFTGAANRAEYGIGAIALAMGALLAL